MPVPRAYTGGPDRRPGTRGQSSEARKATMKKKKQRRAISAAPEAMPPRPNTAATMATMKNVSDQLNMADLLNEAQSYRRDRKKNPSTTPAPRPSSVAVTGL